jgi:hypothetical protein
MGKNPRSSLMNQGEPSQSLHAKIAIVVLWPAYWICAAEGTQPFMIFDLNYTNLAVHSATLIEARLAV